MQTRTEFNVENYFLWEPGTRYISSYERDIIKELRAGDKVKRNLEPGYYTVESIVDEYVAKLTQNYSDRVGGSYDTGFHDRFLFSSFHGFWSDVAHGGDGTVPTNYTTPTATDHFITCKAGAPAESALRGFDGAGVCAAIKIKIDPEKPANAVGIKLRDGSGNETFMYWQNYVIYDKVGGHERYHHHLLESITELYLKIIRLNATDFRLFWRAGEFDYWEQTRSDTISGFGTTGLTLKLINGVGHSIEEVFFIAPSNFPMVADSYVKEPPADFNGRIIDFANIDSRVSEYFYNGYAVYAEDANVKYFKMYRNISIKGSTIFLDLENWDLFRLRNMLKSAFPYFMHYKTLECNVRVELMAKGWFWKNYNQYNIEPDGIFEVERVVYFDFERATL